MAARIGMDLRKAFLSRGSRDPWYGGGDVSREIPRDMMVDMDLVLKVRLSRSIKVSIADSGRKADCFVLFCFLQLAALIKVVARD